MSNLLVRQDESIATVIFNRPKPRNAITVCLDPTKRPVAGVAAARKVLDPSYLQIILMKRTLTDKDL
ncbi:MAG: hypothetical protein C5B48_06505 [Candidatus Rokuibacteriota bacterium]|nr:MAG: hypothetical protein C5B48_06505 [Candidatus Rokubacteria bacterium]